MAEVKKCPHTRFGFIFCDNAGFHCARSSYGVRGSLGIAGHNRFDIFIKPRVKICIAKQTVFDNFGIARCALTLGQRVQNIKISQHRQRLMKCADEIFAMRRVDTGFAAHRTIHLCQ